MLSSNFVYTICFCFIGIYFGVTNNVHPCLTAVEQDSSFIIYEPIYFSKSNYKNNLSAFNKFSKSSYLFNLYTPTMKIIRNIINNSNYIDEHNNPRYYFMRAVEELNNNNFKESKIYFEKFIYFGDSYQNNTIKKRKEFFTQGCSLKDVEWINNYEKTKEFILTDLLITYLSKEINHIQLIKGIEKLDLSSKTFDLYDNLIFIIMKIHKYRIEDFRELFLKNEKIQLNKILFSDNFNYPISSQIESLTMFKYFEAEKYFLNMNFNQEIYIEYMEKDFDEFSNKYLYPLLYHFELKIKIFDSYDLKLYNFIRDIFTEILESYEITDDSSFYKWIDLYKDNDLSSYIGFNKKIDNYKYFIVNNYDRINLDNKVLSDKFTNLVENKSYKIDSLYITKAFQGLNDNNFFFDISKLDQNSYWIPEISDSLKTHLNLNASKIISFDFSDQYSKDNKKIIEASFLPLYIYDFNNPSNFANNILNIINPKESINDGNDPLEFSLKELKLIVQPNGSNQNK